MMRYFLCVVFYGICHTTCLCQKIISPNDSLAFWSDVMFNVHDPTHRELAAVRAEDLLYRLLRDGQLDESRLNPNIIRLELPHYKSHLFTWQCEKNNLYDYFGYYVDSLRNIVRFHREPRQYDRIRNEQFDSDHWYGAVYYHVLPYTFGEESYCVLFGFAQNELKEKFRIIEIMDLHKGIVRLGIPVLKLKDEQGEEFTAQRQVVRYSSTANCVLRFEPDNDMIVYDHIITFEDPMAPGVSSMLPDGSYEAFQYHNGKWNYISKLQTEIQNSAPREKPILNQKKDLFGRDKKG
ncbi:MAG: hypothetical protein U0T81_02130 [Saprospiraceae bacterium]